jgi:hypothetical protein
MTEHVLAREPAPLGEALGDAIRAHIPLGVLADTIQPFPTFSEIYVAALKALRGEIAAASKAVGAEPPMAS